jgi:hypothetical protein
MINQFNPSTHIIQIGTSQGKKDYLPVAWRLVWFREQCAEGAIETEMLHLDLEKGIAVFKAVVTDGQGGKSTGHGSESIKDFRDFVEKAETKAIGRALAALGYGTQFTGDELDEGDRLADAPVSRPQAPTYDPDKPCTEQQLATLDKLRAQLGMQALASTDGLSFGDVASMLKDLQARLQAARKAS